jgi:PAS domain S-box-containing protein
MAEPLRILVVDDDQADAALIVRAIRRAHSAAEFRCVTSMAGVVNELQTFEPQLAITDHRLTGFSGLDVLDIILRQSADTPVIIVTGSLGDEAAADYIKAGATDFLLKSHLVRLAPAVTRALTLRDARDARRKAERERELAERRFRLLVEHSADVITLLGADGVIRYSSQSIAGALGYAPGERVGHSVFAMLQPDHAERARRLFAEQLRGPGSVVQTEVVAQHRDGSWRSVELVATNRLDDEVIAGIVVNWRDISRRKAAEEQVLAEQQRQRAFFAASPLPMWIYDRQSLALVDVNDAAIEHYGYTREEFMNLTLRDLRPPDEVQRLQKALDAGVPQRYRAGVWKHRKKDGSIIDVEVVTTDLMLAGRALSLTALNDITERLRISAEMEESQRMEAIGRLAGGVAHDFNNLLTVVESTAELLLEDLPAESRMREDLTVIQSASREAAALTRQLLAFSRRQVLAPLVLNLNGFIPETRKMLARLLGARVTIRAVLASDLGQVKLDPGQIQQILVNLAVNARDAMPNGGTITIETENRLVSSSAPGATEAEEPGDYVVLRVTDTGVGMDAATRARIFEPFFTTKERGKGTGLGLATVYGIVQQSGGHIRVRSAPGEGSSFEVCLPRVWAQADSLRVAEGSVHSRGAESVLIAEDDDAVRRLLVRCLRLQGYLVLEAADGTEAMRLAAAHSGTLSLLLTDIVMPGVSGPEIARRIREERPTLAVLYVSGYVEDDAVRDALAESGDTILPKPFGPHELAQAVRITLDSAATRRLRTS